jgi:serine/threonine protein kinase
MLISIRCSPDRALATLAKMLKTLKRCHHPNIVRLYGFCLKDPLDTSAYLVFEYLPNGSLETFFQDNDRRSRLPAHRRVQIMFEIARSLHFLHEGGASGYTFFHRDIKPANVCLDANFTAKLIDCGLAKFVEDPQAMQAGSIRRSLLKTSGPLVFGTPGYICPWYGKGTKSYVSACDVYSFGVMMLELITGCLQEGQSGDRTLGDLVERYEEEPDSLKDQDVDPVVGNGFYDVIDRLSSLSKQCVSFKPKDRPTTATLIDELASTLAVMEGRESSNDSVFMPGSDVPSSKCCLCARSMQLGIFCSSVDRHFVDHNCLEEHVVKHILSRLEAPVPCPIEGCESKHFRMDTLYGKISSSTFKLLERVQQGNLGDTDQILALLRKIAGEVSNIAAGVKKMQLQLRRHTAALAKLSTHTVSTCPALFLVVPSNGADKNWRNCIPHIGKKKVKIYFICQHSFKAVSPALDIEVTRKWVKSIAPALKICIFLLKAAICAGKIVGGLPIPMLDVNIHIDTFDEFVGDFLESAMLQDLIRIGEDVAEGSILDEVWEGRATQVVGEAFKILADMANEDKHAGWRVSMEKVLDQTGSNHIYVKREYAQDYA